MRRFTSRSIVATLCLLVLQSACNVYVGIDNSPATALQVVVRQSNVRVGESIDIAFTNDGVTDLYVHPDCYAIERHYEDGWRVPSSLEVACTGFETAVLVAAGQTVSVVLQVWPSADTVTGDFRVAYAASTQAVTDAAFETTVRSTVFSVAD